MAREIVTKSDIVEHIKKLNPELSKGLVERAIEVFFDEMITALICGDRLELRKFCSMVVKKRHEKMVRNPKTNEKMSIGPKGSLHFRVSKDLLKAINSL